MLLLITFSKKHNLLSEAYAAYVALQINVGAMVEKEMPKVTREGGKPRFLTGSLHFNITHTDGLSAVVFSNGEVGVDAERHRNIDIERFSRIESAGSIKEFFDKWTRREAYLKYTSLGLSALSTPIPKSAPITTLDILESYSLSVCGEGEIIIKIF